MNYLKHYVISCFFETSDPGYFVFPTFEGRNYLRDIGLVVNLRINYSGVSNNEFSLH